MDHGYEIISLVAQPPEPKHAKCINADQKNGMPGTIHQCKKRSPNSFCGFVFKRAIHLNLDPPFLYNRLNKHEETNLIYYSETVEFYTRF